MGCLLKHPIFLAFEKGRVLRAPFALYALSYVAAGLQACLFTHAGTTKVLPRTRGSRPHRTRLRCLRTAGRSGTWPTCLPAYLLERLLGIDAVADSHPPDHIPRLQLIDDVHARDDRAEHRVAPVEV